MYCLTLILLSGRTGIAALDRSTLEDLVKLWEENSQRHKMLMHPVEVVEGNYARHFGRNRTHSLVLPAETEVEEELVLLPHLLCTVLGLERSCDVARRSAASKDLSVKSNRGGGNRSLTALLTTWERIQVDSVAVAAYREGIFGLPPRLRRSNSNKERNPPENAKGLPFLSEPSPWTREAVRDAIGTRLHRSGGSPARDWPLTCPFRERHAAMLDSSRLLHDRIIGAAAGASFHRSSSFAFFDATSTSVVFDVLLCHVHADEVVTDPAWKEWFREIAATVPAVGADAHAPLVVQDDGGGKDEEEAKGAEDQVSSEAATQDDDRP